MPQSQTNPRLPIRTASANSMESDLGCTSKIYFDNVTLKLHNVADANVTETIPTQ